MSSAIASSAGWQRRGIEMMKGARYVIAVPDLQASAEFYRTVLGFEVHEIGDPGWRLAG